MTDKQPSAKPNQDEVCPHCQGIGWVHVNVPVGHPLFGKAVPCSCQRQSNLEKRVGRLRELSNLRDLKHMTFDTFDVNGHSSALVTGMLRGALDVARAYADNPQRWLLLQGPYGCGKTHLAAAIANERIAMGHVTLFVVVPDLLDHLRATYAPNSPVSYDQRFEQVRNVELLILDDLGTQNATSWAAEKLYQILNHRYNAGLPTVITSNQRIEDMDPRLASRLRDRSQVETLRLRVPDHRVTGPTEDFGSIDMVAGMTFAEFSSRKGSIPPQAAAILANIVKRLHEYAETPINWIVLRGNYGVGKTHLAAAVATQVAHSGQEALFLVVSDLLDHLRATFGAHAPVAYDKRFRRVLDARLLVLDDYGSENATAWAQEKVFQLLNHRYVKRLPTILTISAPSWERLDERILSRLQDDKVCTIIDINIPPFRGARSPKNPPRQSTRRRN